MWRNDDLFTTLMPTVLGLAGEALPDDARGLRAGRRSGSPRTVAPRCTCPRHRSCTAPASSARSRRSRWAARSSRSSSATSTPTSSGPRSRVSASRRWRSSATRSAGPMVRALDEAAARGRAVRPVVGRAHHQLRRDVDGRGEAGAHGARQLPLLRLARLERGRRLREPDHRARRGDDHRVVPDRRALPGAHRGRAARSSPAPTRSACSRSADPIPLGYYKDDAKTAATFRTFAGERYSIPGDWAKVAADGTVELLGRGSVSINTGGEKVFPEEVEEAMKLHPAVVDAIVVGVPDDRFGEAIAAVVSVHDAHRGDRGRDRRRGPRSARRVQATAATS